MSMLTIILNIVLPPVSLVLNKIARKDLTISIILTFLFFIPGIIHAFYMTSKP
ncbi:MAG: uncharacterized membrane protein YqaE (UPF0057 family) [Nonlabens sp.]|jgi:uncharacterized membrane protein YqaE (UPF0057 family)